MEEIYGPEDIEQLLLSKDFSELYPEERQYVLRHIEGEAEYNAMRMMLLDVSSSEDPISPPARMREEMIAMHEAKHRPTGFKVWLNGLFAMLIPKVEWRRPAMQLAGVAGIILAVTLVYRTISPDLEKGELALEPQKSEVIEKERTVEEEMIPPVQMEESSSPESKVIEEDNVAIEDMPPLADKAEVEFSVTDNYTSNVAKEEYDLDGPPRQESQTEILDIQVEESIDGLVEQIEDDEEVFMDEITTADMDIPQDGDLSNIQTEAMETEQPEVIASAPATTSSLGREANLGASSSAIVPNDLLSLFHTAW